MTTNRALLASVLGDDDFRRGGVGTDFLDVRRGHLSFAEAAPGDIDAALAAVWCATARIEGDALWADSRGWRLAARPSSAWKFADRSIAVEAAAPDIYAARLNSGEYSVRLIERAASAMRVELAGGIQSVHVIESEQGLHLFRGGRLAVLRPVRTDDALQAADGTEEGSLSTPLPGTVVAVHVVLGERVPRARPW